MAYTWDLANWWDSEKRKSEKVLSGFVREHPHFFGILLAGTVQTAMNLGSGYVDVLRLGKGVSEGGWKGYGKDALRVVGVMGPVGKGVKMIRSAKALRLSRLISDPGGRICSWIAATKGLVHTGQRAGRRVLASVDDLIQQVAPQGGAGAITLEAMVGNLRSIGAKVGNVIRATTVKQIARALPRDGSVLQVSLNALRNGKRIGGHAVYAFYDKLGRLRFMDRKGVYNSLDDLARQYSKVDEFVPRAAAQIKNAIMRYVGPKGTATVAIGVLATATADSSSVVPNYYRYKLARGPAQGTLYTVRKDDTLTKIAQLFYEDGQLWPRIYNANKAKVGNNPNVIRIGQKLIVPKKRNYHVIEGGPGGRGYVGTENH